MTDYVHLVRGGGLGDVIRELYFHNVLGMLRRWKMEHPHDHLKLLFVSHNPSVVDLAWGQSWIDEVVVRPYPLEKYWDWWHHYEEYAADFAGCTELRVIVPDYRSNYAVRDQGHQPRTKHTVIRVPSMAWTPALTETELAEWNVIRQTRPWLMHMGAGSEDRAVNPHLVAPIEALLRERRDLVLSVGANYTRLNHGPESGTKLSPRMLLRVLPEVRGVVGTESSVWYTATMLGCPTFLLYHPGHAYARMKSEDMVWDWFFAPDLPKHRDCNLAEMRTSQILDEVRGWAAQVFPAAP